MDYAILGLLDRVCGTYLSARRIFTVHTHHRGGLGRSRAVNHFEVDQRLPAVGSTFHAGLNTGAAANTTTLIGHKDWIVINSEFHARSIRTAATLNSGILEIGSTARFVS